MPDNLSAIWQGQPIDSQSDLQRRHTRSLSYRTRSEILSGAASAAIFVLLLLWRFDAIRDPWVLVTFIPIGLWLLATIWWHRTRIWQTEATLAAPGIDFYRAELERRRSHLSSLWLWHGPLILACLSLGAIWFRKSVISLERLLSISPLLVVLVIWTVLGIRRRRREIAEIQEELNEMP